jgi:DNA-binding NtrC family response regulator
LWLRIGLDRYRAVFLNDPEFDPLGPLEFLRAFGGNPLAEQIKFCQRCLRVAQAIHREERALPLILVTATSTDSLAIADLRAGTTDYFRRPVSFDKLIATITRRLDGSFPPGPPPSVEGGAGLPGGRRMVGESAAMPAIMAHVNRVASVDSTVLITGETGTGKELVAELIHETGPRRRKPLVRINCAAIPDSLLESELFGYERGAFTGAHTSHAGKLESANGGTAFFDEISDMTPTPQAKVLSVIETKEAFRLGGNKRVPLDIRVIAATNQELEPLVATGKFRKDLYFRLVHRGGFSSPTCPRMSDGGPEASTRLT